PDLEAGGGGGVNGETRTLVDAAVGVGIAETPTALSALKKPGSAAVIWRRQTPAEVQGWLDALAPEVLPRGRLILRPGAVAHAVAQLCDMAGTPAGPERAWLEADIGGLAEHFAALLEAPYLRLRLDAVSTTSCPRFHIDAVLARLVCTYRGQGTQYGISRDGEEPRRVFTVATGAPILLRGTLWPADPPSGLLHRSPPTEGTGETRLVLVLDPVFDPGEEM
ncbi:MAG: DUF1826 domain-containing protein, partial [Pseudomonadota bacterium]